MRNPTLFALLRDHVEAAGALLAVDAREGEGVPFDVREASTGATWTPRTPLYCYRPLTRPFIGERAAALAALPTALPALGALDRLAGVERYVRRRDLHGETPARAALAGLVEVTYEGSTDFAFVDERFRSAYAELEAAVYCGRSMESLAVELAGVELESEQVALSDDLRLVAVAGDGPEEARPGAVLAVLTREDSPGAPTFVEAARPWLRRLLTALRLWDAPAPALGPLAWTRLDDGPWRAFPSGASAPPAGLLVLPVPQEDELRAFCSLIARRLPRGGELAWALRRFEMARERPAPLDALTDVLLALRALLEPEGTASGRLSERVAALCAAPEDRAGVASRVARAAAVERGYVTGLGARDPDALALAEEVAAYLRALLRDTICGHLEPDLRLLADELLAEPAASA